MSTKTLDLAAPISGHVWLYQGKRRETWCAKWRDHAGQHEKRLGQAWTGRGRPPQGFLRRREAEALLEEILVDARRGQLRQQHTGLTFVDVAEDWYARGPLERDWSPSTQVDYRSVLDAHLLPKFGARRIETITAEQFEQWRERLVKANARARRSTRSPPKPTRSSSTPSITSASPPTSPQRSSGCAKPATPGGSISSHPRRSNYS
jgi:hypothetical protein